MNVHGPSGVRSAGIALAILVCACAPVHALTYRVPSGVATVPAALALAGSGDSVLIAPGLYYCSVAVPSGVVLRGDGPDSSVFLDSGGDGPVLWMTDASASTSLSNLVLKNGVGQLVNGLRLGGGIYGLRSSPVLSRVRILGCTAAFGAGAYFQEGAPQLRGCVLRVNEADFGGGLALSASAARLDTCRIVFNGATQQGGGIAALNGSTLSVYLCDIEDNTSGGPGGGVALAGSAGTILESGLLRNTAAGDGGGIFCGLGASLDCSFALLWKNAAARGGGMFLGCAEAAAPSLPGGRGAARAPRSGCSVSQLLNNSVLENSASGAGGGVAVDDAAEVRMLNSIVALSPAGGGVACLDLRATLDFRCNDVWRNAPQDWEAGCSAPEHPELNNLSVNPLFCNPEGAVFTLCDNTPLTQLGDCFTTLLGAFDVGCEACSTPVRTMTWGRLRQIYLGAPRGGSAAAGASAR